MDDKRSKGVICFSNLKQAALYFDRIFPVAFRSLRRHEQGVYFEVPEPVPFEVFGEVVFGPNPPDIFARIDPAGTYFHAWDELMKKIGPSRTSKHSSSTEDDYVDVESLYLNNITISNGTSIRQEFRNLAQLLGIEFVSVLLSPHHERDKDDIAFPEYLAVSLSGIPLVDTSTAEWGQIIELRRDSESQNRLRNLRLFLYTNYQGKSVDYIQDDLGKRLHAYELARKKFGFEIVTSCFSTLLESKNLYAAIAGGFVAGLVGGISAAATAGVIIEVGKVALEFAKRRRCTPLSRPFWWQNKFGVRTSLWPVLF
jgi:hypothetical protein